MLKRNHFCFPFFVFLFLHLLTPNCTGPGQLWPCAPAGGLQHVPHWLHAHIADAAHRAPYLERRCWPDWSVTRSHCDQSRRGYHLLEPNLHKKENQVDNLFKHDHENQVLILLRNELWEDMAGELQRKSKVSHLELNHRFFFVTVFIQ